MKRAALFLFCILVLAGCSVNKQLATLDHSPQEAIVAGKLTVYYNGKNVTEKTTILFNEIMWGTYSYHPDSTGYLITKLPLGRSYFSRIAYNPFHNNLPKDLAAFEMTSNDSIYYIGDLTINWQGSKSKMPAGMFGLVGALADEMCSDGNFEFYSENNLESFQEYFRINFDNEMGIKDVTLDFPHLDSLKNRGIFLDPADNPKYLEFTTNKGKKCHGELRKVNKKKVYIISGDTLYVISKKKLATIIDNTGNEITLESISDQDFKAINFNKYETVIL